MCSGYAPYTELFSENIQAEGCRHFQWVGYSCSLVERYPFVVLEGDVAHVEQRCEYANVHMLCDLTFAVHWNQKEVVKLSVHLPGSYKFVAVS